MNSKLVIVITLTLISNIFAIDSLLIKKYLPTDSLPSRVKFYGIYNETIKYSTLKRLSTTNSSQSIFDDDKLQKSGLIYRGFTVDSEGSFKLNSGLNLKVEGEIYRDLSLKAAINDDELALSSKGETESVSSIDNIFMEVEHPNFLLRLGDNQFGYDDRGEYGNFSRKVSGGFIKGRYKKSSSSASYAVTKAKFTTSEFDGIDGVQGPYRLSDKEGNIEASIIVPGSETIYINGKKLSKGSSKDYTIDYDFGEIYFTPLRVVKGGDKIVVDYEINDDNYKKGLYLFDLDLNHSGYFFKNYYYSEQDDYKNPIGFDLSDEYKDILKNGGDNPDSSYVESAIFVGDTLGTYNDTIVNGARYYIYMGENLGSYNVSFSKFDNGFYDREIGTDGKVKFIFNPSGGDYMHYTRIPLPSRLDYNHAQFGYQNDRVTVKGEFALSRYQRNSLSSSRESSFSGLGDNQEVEYRSPPINFRSNFLGEVKLNLKRESYNRSFYTPSRIGNSNFDKEYGVALKDSSNFSEYSGNLLYNYKSFAKLNNIYSYSEINDTTKSSYISSRFSGESPLLHNYDFEFKLRETENSISKYNRENYNGTTTYKLDNIFFKPGYQKELIIKRTQDDLKEDKAINLLSIYYDDNSSSNLTGLDYQYETNRVDSGSGYYNLNYINNFKAYSKQIWSSSLRSDLLWNRRDIHYAIKDSSDTTTDLLRNSINYNYDNRYTLDIDYEVNSSFESSSIKVYYETEPGEGSYALVNGEYILDDNGDWDFYIKTHGKKVPLTTVKASLNYDLDFEEIEENRNINYWLSRFDTYGSLSIEEKSSTEDRVELLLLNFDQLQNDSTIYGSIEFENNLLFNKEYRKWYLDLGYYFSNRVMKQYVNESEKQKIRRYEPAIVLSNKKYYSKFTYGYETEKLFYIDSDISSKDIIKNYYKLNLSFYPSYSTTVSSLFKYGYDNDKNRDQDVNYFEISPELSYSFMRKGVVRLGATYFRAISDHTYSVSLADGYTKGENYRVNLNGNYNINNYFTFNLGYNGRKLSRDLEFIHELNAELKLEF